MPGVRARWRALHRWTRAGAVAGALAMLIPVSPVTVAVLLLRCCDSNRGAHPGAWAVAGLVLLVAATGGALVGGLAGAGLRRLLRR